MAKYYYILLLFCYFNVVQAQEFVYVNDNISDATITIRIANEVAFPDIQVLLGRDIPFEDITVGITPFKSQANYIITKRPGDANRVVKIDNCDNFPDLSILVKSELSFPDVRIEFRDNSSFVDLLIYSEKTTISEQELIACLLPFIREKANK
jgi:hypothetical protein